MQVRKISTIRNLGITVETPTNPAVSPFLPALQHSTQLNSTLLISPQKQIQDYNCKLSVRNVGWTERQRSCTNNCPSKTYTHTTRSSADADNRRDAFSGQSRYNINIKHWFNKSNDKPHCNNDKNKHVLLKQKSKVNVTAVRSCDDNDGLILKILIGVTK